MKQKKHAETILFPMDFSQWLQKPPWTVGLSCTTEGRRG